MYLVGFIIRLYRNARSAERQICNTYAPECMGTAVAQCLSAVLQIGRSLVGSQLVSVDFDIKFFRSHYGPGVDSASNRNEYQEYFLGIKAVRA